MELRTALRSARVEKFRSARDFADLAGISHSTVAKIENLRKKPDYDPGVVVVSKYLKPLGFTLPQFLLQIERQTNPHSTPVHESATSTSPLKVTPGGGGHGADRPVSSAEKAALADDIAVEVFNRIYDAIRRIDPIGEQATTTRAAGTKRIKVHRKNRR